MDVCIHVPHCIQMDIMFAMNAASQRKEKIKEQKNKGKRYENTSNARNVDLLLYTAISPLHSLSRARCTLFSFICATTPGLRHWSWEGQVPNIHWPMECPHLIYSRCAESNESNLVTGTAQWKEQTDASRRGQCICICSRDTDVRKERDIHLAGHK